jgi:hypothetical protein
VQSPDLITRWQVIVDDIEAHPLDSGHLGSVGNGLGAVVDEAVRDLLPPSHLNQDVSEHQADSRRQQPAPRTEQDARTYDDKRKPPLVVCFPANLFLDDFAVGIGIASMWIPIDWATLVKDGVGGKMLSAIDSQGADQDEAPDTGRSRGVHQDAGRNNTAGEKR